MTSNTGTTQPSGQHDPAYPPGHDPMHSLSRPVREPAAVGLRAAAVLLESVSNGRLARGEAEVSAVDEARPQDSGRPHRRRGAPSEATRSLLADYQAAMRSELAGVLVELHGKVPAPGLLDDVVTAPERPSLADRMRLWDLAIKLGRELGSEIEPLPSPAATSPLAPKRGRGRVDFG